MCCKPSATRARAAASAAAAASDDEDQEGSRLTLPPLLLLLLLLLLPPLLLLLLDSGLISDLVCSCATAALAAVLRVSDVASADEEEAAALKCDGLDASAAEEDEDDGARGGGGAIAWREADEDEDGDGCCGCNGVVFGGGESSRVRLRNCFFPGRRALENETASPLRLPWLLLLLLLLLLLALRLPMLMPASSSSSASDKVRRCGAEAEGFRANPALPLPLPLLVLPLPSLLSLAPARCRVYKIRGGAAATGGSSLLAAIAFLSVTNSKATQTHTGYGVALWNDNLMTYEMTSNFEGRNHHFDSPHMSDAKGTAFSRPPQRPCVRLTSVLVCSGA